MGTQKSNLVEGPFVLLQYNIQQRKISQMQKTKNKSWIHYNFNRYEVL